MAEFIVGKTANEVWKKAAELILKQNKIISGRNGNTFELLNTFISISEPKQKWVYSRVPPISIGYALAELVWIMNGEDRSDIINTWNPKLEKYAGKGSFYYGAYGKRIRHHFGFDQLVKAYEALQNCPESRQVVIQIYDAKIDFPIEKGAPRSSDIPCNICSMLKVRDQKLEWTQIMRSNDIFRGMPYNFIQFTGLQEILSGWLGLDIGSYNHYSDSLHLYDEDINKFNIEDERVFFNSDSLALCMDESEKLFKEIYFRMKILMKRNVSQNEIDALAKLNSNYSAYDNIMLVIAVYISYKQRYKDLTKELIALCTNDLYVAMWNKWADKNI